MIWFFPLLLVPTSVKAMCSPGPCYVAELEVERCRIGESFATDSEVAVVQARIKSERKIACADKASRQSARNLKAPKGESSSIFTFIVKKGEDCKNLRENSRVTAFIATSCCDADYPGCDYSPAFNGELIEK